MKVAYVFATAGQTIDYVLGDMITAVAEVADVAAEQEILLMLCDQCATRRGLAEFDHTDEHGRDHYEPTDTVQGATVGCFPDLYEALGEVGVDQVITL